MTEVKYDIGGKEINVKYDENGIAKITRECFEALIEKQTAFDGIERNGCPSWIVQIDFVDLCKNCKHMGIRYCKDSHCDVESFCKLSGIEHKLCDSANCPLIYRESEV